MFVVADVDPARRRVGVMRPSNPIVVLDNGASTIKAGIVDNAHSEPRYLILIQDAGI
jgi:hypothetical protein